jgi:hypothetical protein
LTIALYDACIVHFFPSSCAGCGGAGGKDGKKSRSDDRAVTFKECEEMSNLPSSLSWSNEWVIALNIPVVLEEVNPLAASIQALGQVTVWEMSYLRRIL